MEKFLSKKEIDFLKKLNNPAKIQDYLNSLTFNFEKNGPTAKSPLLAMRAKNAHCLEGAILGAYLLKRLGFKPYLLLLKASGRDFDHVIAPFKKSGLWGALSKTNHSVLRYREPVYKNIRELAMSYFHEYFLDSGVKTLKSYSGLLNLNSFVDEWEYSRDPLWGIDEELDKIKHHNIVPRGHKLRKADEVEIKSGEVVEYKND